jgi:lipopolysaccharide/colanic/teichoic acid biosynthesis glycosyltransferase
MIRLFRVFVPVGALALLFSEVLLVASCFLVVTFLILNVDPAVFLFADNGLLRIGVVVASILFGLFFEDLYTQISVKSRVVLLQQLCLVMGIAFLIQGFISYVRDGLRLPIRVMVPGSALVIVALFAWRIVYGVFVLRVVGAQRILFVGSSPVLHEMASYIEAHPEVGMCSVGYIDDSPDGTGGAQARGPLSALPQIAATVKPDRIIVGFVERRGQMPIVDLLQLRYGGLAIEEASTAYEQLRGRVLLSELRPSELVLSGAFRQRSQRLLYQTLGNGLLALILTVVSAPLLLLAAALIKLSSRGPLLIRKECTGLGGKPFYLYGLRLPGGEETSRVESFVKRWRLYALPHLWNVLRGEMCFVGPRAERPEFVDALTERIPFYRQRYRVKPGLTGWAQINMPTDQPEDTLLRLEYDFYYLKNLSRGLDSYILLHTLRELLISRAA